MLKSYHSASTLLYGSLPCCLSRLMQAGAVSLHPFGLLLWAAWSRLSLVPPSKYRCPVCGLVALHSAWHVACALLLFFVFTVASKAVALCGVARPSTTLCAFDLFSAFLH